MVRIISAIAIFCLLPSSAALADASAFGTPLWTGLYIGAGGGLKALNNTVTAVPGDAVKDDPGAIGAHVSLDGLGGDGAFFSLGIGGDYQFHDRFLVGAFFDYDFDTLATNVDVSIPGIPLQAHGKVEIDDSWSVGGRLGFLPSPSALLFLSAGYTRLGSTDISANISGPAEISARAASPASPASSMAAASRRCLPITSRSRVSTATRILEAETSRCRPSRASISTVSFRHRSSRPCMSAGSPSAIASSRVVHLQGRPAPGAGFAFAWSC